MTAILDNRAGRLRETMLRMQAPYALRPPVSGMPQSDSTWRFAEVRRPALIQWQLQRLDDEGEPWECRWQAASTELPHGCDAPGCDETHVSLYCSFNGEAEQFDDLLSDVRLDDLLLGLDPDLKALPTETSDDGTAALFRFYVRVLWAAEVLLDDMQELLRLAGQSDGKSARSTLSKGAPLDVDTLRAFVSHVGKHGVRVSKDRSRDRQHVHCWNHHSPFFFEDGGIEHQHLDPRYFLTAHRTPDRGADFQALVMPRMADIVGTVTAALRNLDTRINDPEVLARLARGYGTCW